MAALRTRRRTLVTHIFVAGGPYLESDAVFDVKDCLVVEFAEHPAGTATPDGREYRRGRRGSPRPWPRNTVNDDAVKHARKLIDAGTYDDKTEWSDAAPSADDANKEIDKESFDDFASGTWASTPKPQKAPRADMPFLMAIS